MLRGVGSDQGRLQSRSEASVVLKAEQEFTQQPRADECVRQRKKGAGVPRDSSTTQQAESGGLQVSLIVKVRSVRRASSLPRTLTSRLRDLVFALFKQERGIVRPAV